MTLRVSIFHFKYQRIRDGPSKSPGFTDGSRASLVVGRAKSASQLKRNGALRDACTALKKDAANAGKTVDIVWQITDSKERQVTVNNVPAFSQSAADFEGHFLAPFAHLIV